MFKNKTYNELINYILVGAATTFVNWVIYSIMVSLAGISITFSNICAWIISVAFAFVTNKIWVFHSRSWHPSHVLREGISFLGARIVSGLIDITGVPLLHHFGLNYPLFGIEGFAAKVTVSVIVLCLNYVFSKFFIFRHKNS